jgi:hypothetical protein
MANNNIEQAQQRSRTTLDTIVNGFKDGLAAVVNSTTDDYNGQTNTFFYHLSYYCGAMCGIFHPERSKRIYNEAKTEWERVGIPDDLVELFFFPIHAIQYGVPMMVFEPKEERQKRRTDLRNRNGFFSGIKEIAIDEAYTLGLKLIVRPFDVIITMYTAIGELYEKQRYSTLSS